MLARLGLQREDRVAMIMLDTVDFPILFWGAIRAGIIPIPLNTLLPVEQFRYILEDSRAKALFVSPPFLKAAETAMAGLPLKTLVVVGDAPAQYPSFGKLLDAESAAAPAETSADEVAFWLYSSGSTGMPKGVRHVHSSPMATAKLYGQGVLGITEDDVCFSAGKLYHAYGLGNGMSFPMSVGATAVLLPDRPTPAAIFEVLRREQPTLFFGAPTLYAMMLADPACTPENGSKRLRWCVSAAEALPEHVGTEWKKRFGVDILDGIGSTEMLHIFVSNQPGKLRYGTTGVAVPGYDLRIVDDKGADVPDGELGELLVRGPTAAEGYWNQREKTRRTFEGEWTRTGDIYVRDADGMYRYCGRNDDMFKVSGLWVSPFDVESALIIASRRARSCRRVEGGWRRAVAAEGVHHAEGWREGRRSAARGAEGAREAADRHVEIPALDRVRGQPAEDRDGEDPEIQAEGLSCVPAPRSAGEGGERASRVRGPASCTCPSPASDLGPRHPLPASRGEDREGPSSWNSSSSSLSGSSRARSAASSAPARRSCWCRCWSGSSGRRKPCRSWRSPPSWRTSRASSPGGARSTGARAWPSRHRRAGRGARRQDAAGPAVARRRYRDRAVPAGDDPAAALARRARYQAEALAPRAHRRGRRLHHRHRGDDRARSRCRSS